MLAARKISNSEDISIIRNGEMKNPQKREDNENRFLGRKRENGDRLYEKLLNHTQKVDMLEVLKRKEREEELLTKKLEFKLSHILHGENILSADNRAEKNNRQSNKSIKKHEEIFNDEMINDLMGWKKPLPIGGGLNNLGNTCFLNSVLQSMLYTSPIRNYVDSSDHIQACTCTSSITPKNIAQNIRLIARHLKIGRQEDAHEFLIYLLDSLEKSANMFKQNQVKNFITKNEKEKEDNLIQKVFGGEMMSSVMCLKCKTKSNKRDKFLDISLDIYNSESIEKCFEDFCKTESLHGSNKYFCDKCKARNDSYKKFSFLKFPRILILHLKRFDNFQRKIKKFVRYSDEIDLTRFISTIPNEKFPEQFKYKLFSVLVHEGFSINSGHYYCYVRDSKNQWYEMNDSLVSKSYAKNVLQQSPYLLFYERILEKNPIISTIAFNPVSSTLPQSHIFTQKQMYNNSFQNKEQHEDSNNIIPHKEEVENNGPRTEDKDELNMILPKINFSSKLLKKLKHFFRLLIQKNQRRSRPKKIIDSVANIDDVTNKNKNYMTIEKEFLPDKNEEPSGYEILKQTFYDHMNSLKEQNSIKPFHKNLVDLYGSDKIELWDTENDSDLVQKQIKFIKHSNGFQRMKIKEKDKYDEDYDMGKVKKVQEKKHANFRWNHFQKLSDQLFKH